MTLHGLTLSVKWEHPPEEIVEMLFEAPGVIPVRIGGIDGVARLGPKASRDVGPGGRTLSVSFDLIGVAEAEGER